jgi:hypothetical protein
MAYYKYLFYKLLMMGLKTIFILIVIILLGIFLLTSESGKKYLNFLRGKLEELGEVKPPTITPGKTLVSLSLQFRGLKDKKFTVTNSAFEGYGMYKEVFYGKTKIESEKEVNVKIQIQRGNIIFKDENVRVFASTKSFELSDIKFTPEEPIDVSIEITPTNFTILNILEESITFSGITGELRGVKGTVIPLEERNIEIKQFNGNLTYINQTITLSGNVTKVLINGNDITSIVV